VSGCLVPACPTAPLQTRAANPHFLPEVQAHCVVVNFGVTRQGLEQQLLTCVVGMEVPSLERDLATTRVRRRPGGLRKWSPYGT
jgi:hypothetical protein